MLPLLDNHSAKHSPAIVYYSYLHPVLKILIQQHVKSECFPSIKHCTLPKQHSNLESIHLPAPLLYPTREWNNDKPWSHTPCSKISNLYQKQCHLMQTLQGLKYQTCLFPKVDWRIESSSADSTENSFIRVGGNNLHFKQ